MKKSWTFQSNEAALLYSQLQTAHEFGKLPSELGICEPADDLDLMKVFITTRSHMTAWESQENEKEADKRRKEAESKRKRK